MHVPGTESFIEAEVVGRQLLQAAAAAAAGGAGGAAGAVAAAAAGLAPPPPTPFPTPTTPTIQACRPSACEAGPSFLCCRCCCCIWKWDNCLTCKMHGMRAEGSKCLCVKPAASLNVTPNTMTMAVAKRHAAGKLVPMVDLMS